MSSYADELIAYALAFGDEDRNMGRRVGERAEGFGVVGLGHIAYDVETREEVVERCRIGDEGAETEGRLECESTGFVRLAKARSERGVRVETGKSAASCGCWTWC